MSAAAEMTAPATAEPAAAAMTAPSPAPAAQPAANDWYSGISNEQTRTWAQAKGWKDPMAAVESAYNLEKMIGFDKAGRTLVIPTEDSTPEQRAAFNQKLGVPETVDGYKLEVPEGAPPEFSKWAAGLFHKNGVPAKAAEGIVTEWNQYQAAEQAKQEQAIAVQSSQEFDAVKAEWGKAYPERIELARRAMTDFLPAGNSEERGQMMSAIERAMGTGNFLKFAYGLGSGLGEHKLHSGGNAPTLDPAQAKQQIEVLKSNKEWTASYLAGDKGKAQQLQDLISLANPEG